jgi:hypothetical protein
VRLNAGLVEGEVATLAALQTERTAVLAKCRQIETEAAPIRYVAELIGTNTDSERAIRWLIALMVLCCDPLAIAPTAAASARREMKWGGKHAGLHRDGSRGLRGAIRPRLR